MLTVAGFKKLRVLVLGLGLHGGGLAVANWLLSQGALVTISDFKTSLELQPSLKKLKRSPRLKLVLGKQPLTLLKNCDLIIQNPAVPREAKILKAARQKNIPIENEASLFLKICPSQHLAAVTGSKGKSTTVSLLGQMVKTTFANSLAAGNIRDTVMFEALKKINQHSRLILELSSWQLEVMDLHKQRVPLAVITNILPDHLNRYDSLAHYVKAKAALVRWQKATDQAVLNYDNVRTRALAKQTKAKVYWFSLSKQVRRGCYIKNNFIYWQNKKIEKIMPVADVKLKGQHNLANILAAVAAGRLIGLPVSKMAKTLRTYKGLHDRLELVRRFKGRYYYNDTTATAPVATIAALKTFTGQAVALIAGGQDKNLEYGELAKQIIINQAVLILLPGTATVKLLAALPKDYPYLEVDNMKQAVKLANSSLGAAKGGVVLLSPGATSFNLFKHEFDRGQQFIKEVKSLV